MKKGKKMKQRVKESKLERKYCGYDCKFAKAVEDRGACQTFTLIYCKKYDRQVDKGQLCLEYEKWIK